MPAFLSNLIPSSAVIYIIGALAAIGVLWYAHHSGYVSGEAAYKLKIQVAQAKYDKKVKADYAKIDNSLPKPDDQHAIADFLLQHVRNDSGK